MVNTYEFASIFLLIALFLINQSSFEYIIHTALFTQAKWVALRQYILTLLICVGNNEFKLLSVTYHYVRLEAFK